MRWINPLGEEAVDLPAFRAGEFVNRHEGNLGSARLLTSDRIANPNLGSANRPETIVSLNENCHPLAMTNLQMEFLAFGDGPPVEAGQIVVVHYTGRLTNGQKFDSSVDRNEPFEVAAGVGQVIQGWDVTLLRMRTGDKVKVTIPPELAYGAGGAGGIIPPNATLVFEMELLKVK